MKKDLPQNSAILLKNLLYELNKRLKCAKFHGHYFDRQIENYNSQLLDFGDDYGKMAKPISLCNELGVFTCQGRWDKEKCLYMPQHQINPYTSREERIIFQTWNLDHNIERTRNIIPNIYEALLNLNKKHNMLHSNNDITNYLDVKRIYSDLFTLNNLKFVHIVCHDKGAHCQKVTESYLI